MARKLKVDFEGVESYVRCEEGQHVAVIKEITEETAKESSNDMLVVKFEVIKGESKGAIVYNNFVLVDKALWRLKQLLEAVGIKVPDGRMVIDLDKLEGKKLIIEVSHEEYNGQTRARLQECLPLNAGKKDEDEPEDEDVDDEDEEEEDEPAPKKGKKSPPAKKPAAKSKKKPVDDDDEDWEDD